MWARMICLVLLPTVSNKYSANNIDTIIKSINEENLPIFGLKNANGGYYLTGYKYEKSEKYISDYISTGIVDHRILQHCRYQ